jgi:leucyl-tRNA---protein transferase
VTTPPTSDSPTSRYELAASSFELPMLPLSDHEHRCVYRPSQQARIPLLYPTRKLRPEELDIELAKGRRRSGSYLYFTACPRCSSCEPTRLELSKFSLSRSMKRVLNRGNRAFEVRLGPPQECRERLQVFNRHRLVRQLASNKEAYTAEDFRGFLVETCCDSYELSYWDEDQLIGCTIVDLGNRTASAVYTYFDPIFESYSIGTYSILKQIEWAKSQELKYLYLGMFVEENQHLRYKGRFTPQERLINGRWQLFESPLKDWSSSADQRTLPNPSNTETQ